MESESQDGGKELSDLDIEDIISFTLSQRKKQHYDRDDVLEDDNKNELESDIGGVLDDDEYGTNMRREDNNKNEFESVSDGGVTDDDGTNMRRDNNKNELYNWVSLPKQWNAKLLNDNFVVKDCKGDGNCQFRSIESALTNAGYKTDHVRLRKAIARYITKMSKDEFQNILESYRLEKENGEFQGKWNPLQVKTKKDFISNVTTTGFHFEGDNITLSILSKAIGIDFIILDNSYNVTDLSNNDNYNEKIVILYYIKDDNHSGHYQTIGLKKNKKIITMFLRSNLPKEIDLIIDRHTYLLEHINHIYQTTIRNNLTLNHVIKQLEHITQTKLNTTDKKSILIILRNILQNEAFFTYIKKSKAHSKDKSPKKRSKSKSPKRSKSKSPKRSKSKSPKRSKSKSPKRSKSKSPKKRSKRKSPKRSKSKSPKRSKSKSPKRSKSKSPKKRSKSKSPKRSKIKSPKRSKRKSPKRSKRPKQSNARKST